MKLLRTLANAAFALVAFGMLYQWPVKGSQPYVSLILILGAVQIAIVPNALRNRTGIVVVSGLSLVGATMLVAYLVKLLAAAG